MLATAWVLAWTLLDPTSPAPPSLEWTAPASCPERAGVQALTEMYLGGPMPEGPESRVSVAAELRSEGGGSYALTLRLRSGEGSTEENHRDASCEELAKLTAIKVALLLDPEGFVDRYEEIEELAKEALAKRDPQPQPPPQAPPPTPTPVAPAERRGPELRTGFSLGGSWGLLPGTTGMLMTHLGLVGKLWRVDVRGQLTNPAQARIEEDPAVGFALLHFGGGVVGCARPSARKLIFNFCGGIEAGALRAQGVGTVPAQVATRPYAGALITGGLSYDFSWGAIFLNAESAAALTRARIAFTDGPDLYTVPPINLRALTGLEFRIPRH